MNVFKNGRGYSLANSILRKCGYSVRTYGKGTSTGALDSRTEEHLNDWQSGLTAA